MPSWMYNDWPSIEVQNLRKAWRAHYIAKGCNSTKAMWLAHKKTHTWPPPRS
jgi:hypothetical protein